MCVFLEREMGGYFFFLLPFIWIILWTLGVLCASKGRATQWFFRFSWCTAMFLGATVMLLLSFFAILSVGWADFCVNLVKIFYIYLIK